jgi:hypothetical protein
MAEVGKALAQVVSDGVGISKELYVCPTGTYVKIESIFVCNQSTSPQWFTISVDKGGDNPGAPETKDFLYYAHTIAASETFVVNDIIRLEADDRVEGESETTQVVFNLYGMVY